MAFDADAIVARRRLRRRLAFWRILGVAALVALLLVGVSRFVPLDGMSRPHIARLNVTGLLIDDAVVGQRIAALPFDPSVRAVLVVIDSPGGTTTGGEVLYRDLRRVAEAGIPVVATVRTVGASAGYLVALAADRIYALETSITGSIGVLLQTAEISDLLDGLGISTETYRSAPLKGQPSLLEPTPEAARAATQAMIDDVYEWFLAIFAERRGLALDDARRLADGRAYTGRQAFELGLIDAIGGEREAIAWLVENRGLRPGLPVRDLEAEDTPVALLDVFLGWFEKTLFSERVRLDGLISVWHADGN